VLPAISTLSTLSTLSVLGIIALALALHADAPLTHHGGLVLVSVLTVLAIAGAVISRASPVCAALDWRPLRWIGER